MSFVAIGALRVNVLLFLQDIRLDVSVKNDTRKFAR